MDYSKIGFEAVWEEETVAKKHREMAIFYACLFGWFGTNLLVSIIRTISTNPGNIPDEREWDMVTDDNGDSSEDAPAQQT